ncbi:efflux RND transporter periplasmic adaptor subunit [Aliiglaciecola aliphaticivorans]
MYEQDATSRREYEQAESNSKAAVARVTQAESALADAERNLRYTRVEAPITGMSGIESLSEGNLVDIGTMLTRVTQIDPINAHFSLPEATAIVRRWRMHQAPEMDTYKKAWLIMPDGREYARSGEINFVANRVDEESASIVMRAEFTNPDNLLIPGQLIRVRVLLGHYDEAFLIDPTAVSQGANGPFVYVVNKDKAESRQVELGPEIDGKQVIIDGLVDGDQLVINGHVSLTDGTSVDPISADEQE